jgi:hypothetical protein
MLPKFELFIEQFVSENPTVSDIYSFYYLNTLFVNGQAKGDYAKFIMDETVNRIKNRYIRIFSNLLKEQLVKYIKRKRVDNHVTQDKIDKASTFELWEMMKGTYRSDMKRRNDVWNLLAEYVYKLSNAQSLKDKFFFIDRINNCVHNTSEFMFSKFTNAPELLRAFDEIHNAQSLNAYKHKVTKDIREIENN